MRKKQVAQALALIFLCLPFWWWVKEEEWDKEETGLSRQEVELSWYSDYIFWQPPPESGSGSNQIAQNTGVRIKYMVPEDNGDIRLSLMMTNGSMPDIISVSDPVMIRHLIDSGQVWRIDELLESYLPDSGLLREYPEDIKEELTEQDGGWYGLKSNLHSTENKSRYRQPEPFWEEMQRQKSDYGIIWNKALLKRMGLSPGRLGSEEEVLAAFQMVLDKEITVNGKAVIPLQVDGSRYQDTTLQVLFGFFGAGRVDDRGRYSEEILTEQGRHALGFFNEMLRKNYTSPAQFVMTPYQVKRALNSGQVLCFIGDIIGSGIDPEEWVSNGVILSSEGDKPVLDTRCRESRDMTTFVSKSCLNPQAAAVWLDYITGEEGMKAYLADHEAQWWPLRDDDWYYAMKQDPDDSEIAWKQILCAFARAPETKISPELPQFTVSDQYIRELERELSSYMAEEINTLIMEETREEFDREFDIFLDNLEKRGIRKLEKWKRDYAIRNS